jgi:asparagine synthetase B (glutamine-hydrolysing)
MCGIAGFWSTRLDDATAVQTLRGMTDALLHRGPDDAGAQEESEASSFAFVIFVAFWGLFSHNVVSP